MRSGFLQVWPGNPLNMWYRLSLQGMAEILSDQDRCHWTRERPRFTKVSGSNTTRTRKSPSKLRWSHREIKDSTAGDLSTQNRR